MSWSTILQPLFFILPAQEKIQEKISDIRCRGEEMFEWFMGKNKESAYGSTQSSGQRKDADITNDTNY